MRERVCRTQSANSSGVSDHGHPEVLAPTKRIAVFRALYLGDLLLAVPALRSLRAGFPNAEITLIGLPWAAEFAERFSHYVDRFVEFPGYRGLDEVQVDPQRTEEFLVEQRRHCYDLVIQLHGSGEISNAFALELGGKMTVGYDPSTSRVGPKSIFAPYPRTEPEVMRNLALVQMLGCRHRHSRLEFPLRRCDRSEAAALLGSLPEHNLLIGIHPGSKMPSRRWPVESFAATADQLWRTFGAQIVLTGTTEEERTVQAVADFMEGPAVCLAGKTSLGGLGAVLQRLDLLICNDTGPAHVAEAVQTPTIRLFGPGDPVRWAALDRAQHAVVRQAIECSPCLYATCPIDHRCMKWIKPETVLDVVERFLSSEALCSA